MGNKVIQLQPGDSLVWLRRGDRKWPLALYWRISKDEPTEWNLTTVLQSGDQLVLPHDELGLISVSFDCDACNFGLFAAASSRVGLKFMTQDACPACDTYTTHDVELPEIRDWATYLFNRYVLRTCIVCDTSWEQAGY